MLDPFDYPVYSTVVAFALFFISARVGVEIGRKRQSSQDAMRDDITLLLGALLTFLGLIVGFTFSMAMSRYDQRKNLEEEEANAIGTEYVRVDVLPDADAAKARSLLKDYLDLRIRYYKTRNKMELQQVNAQTAQLQNELWHLAANPAKERETPITALLFSGMNDVLNSQSYTQAAWRNRIPIAAWILLITISVFCNFMIGYRAAGRNAYILLILPIALAISLFLVADIDSPRRGVIRVKPQNLQSLAESLHSAQYTAPRPSVMQEVWR